MPEAKTETEEIAQHLLVLEENAHFRAFLAYLSKRAQTANDTLLVSHADTTATQLQRQIGFVKGLQDAAGTPERIKKQLAHAAQEKAKVQRRRNQNQETLS